MAPFKRVMVVSNRLSIVTVVLSVTICKFGHKFQGVPLGIDPSFWGLRRANIPG